MRILTKKETTQRLTMSKGSFTHSISRMFHSNYKCNQSIGTDITFYGPHSFLYAIVHNLLCQYRNSVQIITGFPANRPNRVKYWPHFGYETLLVARLVGWPRFASALTATGEVGRVLVVLLENRYKPPRCTTKPSVYTF